MAALVLCSSHTHTIIKVQKIRTKEKVVSFVYFSDTPQSETY